MTKKLFSNYTIKNVTLKNRIVMSPMCMYSCVNEDGKVMDWHLTHYTSRAVGQVGLIIVEATAIDPQGRISPYDLGIWNDEQIEGLKQLTEMTHVHGSKIGIQLAHAGRKAEVEGNIIAPSSIPFNDEMRTPQTMSLNQIQETIQAFQEGARRAEEAGFDVIEIHGAHGYLISSFLSPLTNQRTDEYGGSKENRYRFLSQVIEVIKEEWEGPLIVRISANDYTAGGNTPSDFIYYAKEMKEQGVDLVDCSSGGIVPASIDAYPGYQVKYADQIRNEGKMATGAVGLIVNGLQAEEILKNERADLIFIGRELLRDPYWAKTAAKQLRVEIDSPVQYSRAW
ncbi:NADPH dehydrogenase NamA [Chengkuizengella axinellae]|uniref:NADPH dehydrogenase n=1 Tax=Chengkuizengella axinellae TaxID=3064388 RepID=A0ABT9IU39_9BACL|nr:NADPH dehydrogenase NamA [Chengkuizengella sp. 2205SS18-9]MDP5272866.1 NADPH dehydrogenase NamA [Chengkuizengella sp. 2205SS18-9]